MHRSRLVGLVIDCQGTDLDTASAFWGAALGRPEVEREGKYATLSDRGDETRVLLQMVDHPSRVHLDVETDDVPAEVARLEALGAKPVAKVHTWQVLEAPTGHRFCVVRPQRGRIEGGTVWGEGDPPAFDPKGEASLRATVAALSSAWLEKRFDDLEPLFEEGVIFVAPDGSRATGRAACIDGYRRFMESCEVTAYEERDLVLDRPNPTVAVATYAWTMSWTRDGTPHVDSGKDMLTLHRNGGVWRVVWRTMLPI